MPFARPTLADLITRIRGDLRGRLSIAGPLLRRAFADVLAAVWAGGVHTLHGYLQWLGKQLFADQAEDEFLLRQASMYGITRTPATFGTGTATATGVNGEVIPISTILAANGHTYITTAAATIALGVATLALQATDAGTAPNLDVGVTMTFQSPIAGVNATATVATAITGFDQEAIEGVRARLLLRLQEPPEGGANQDYIEWTLAVAGVTRAWVYPNELGLGTVVVRFVLDAQVPILPTVGEVAAVQAALNAQRPITAAVTALAPTSLPVNFTIHLSPDTADTRAAVTAELVDLLARDGIPGDGAGLGTIFLSRINTAIGVAAGVTDYALTVPAANVVPAAGQLPVLGVITWV